MPAEEMPLVSCICVTSNSVDILQRAIRCFFHQTYSNKEFIAAYSADNKATAAFLKTLNDPRIIPVEMSSEAGFTLGEKRNYAIEKSNGFYFCVWDDDDWYSNFRIEIQVRSLKNTHFKSSALQRLLLYDSFHKQAYLSSRRRAWEQTLICEKSVMNSPDLRYAALNKGEDAVLVQALDDQNLLGTVLNSGLYVYVYHGVNTCGREHWEQNIFSHAEKFSKRKSAIIRRILSDKYSHEEASLLMGEIFIVKRQVSQ